MRKSKSRIPILLFFISLLSTIILVVVLKALFDTRPLDRYDANFQQNKLMSPYLVATPSPTQQPKQTLENLKKETIHRDNPDKTLAFYYTADTPSFSPTGLTSNGQQNQDDPFKLMINGDASYFTQKAVNQGWGNNGSPLSSNSYTAIIKPMIIDLRSNSKHELKSVDKGMISGNGYTRVLRWVDNTFLLSRSCGEGVGCDFDLIKAQEDVLIPYASTNVSGFASFTTKSRVKNYTLVQSCSNSEPCDIKIYKDLPIKTSNYASFDLSKYSPVNTIKTTKYINTFILDDENIATLNQRAKFYLSRVGPFKQNATQDGYLLFDLVTGTVMEEKNL